MATKYFATEAELQSALSTWFKKMDLPHSEHPVLGNGSIPDFKLKLFDGGPDWGLVEVKKDLTPETFNIGESADHLEQCIKYHYETGLPVFLGPVFISSSGISHYLQGGIGTDYALAPFSSYAGRMNIGLIFINAEPGFETDINYWYGFRITMRGKPVAQYFPNKPHFTGCWPDSQIQLVSFKSCAASKNIRK